MDRHLRSASALARFALLVLATLIAGCRGVAPNGFGGDVEALLRQGEGRARALRSAPPGTLSEPDLVALGYLERVRLGLGSPFRAVDYLLRDPLLPVEAREEHA